METPPFASDLKRQESEVEAELKLALQEACLEAGISLSQSIATKALLRNLEPNSVTVDKLARWFVSTRIIRSQFFSKRTLSLIDSRDGSSKPSSSEPELENSVAKLSVHDRLQKAAALNINSSDFSWEKLISVHGTEHATDSGAEDKETPASLEVTVNSGGVVYFALFRHGTENGEEAAACLKFTPSRLATQSERLGYELARHLGVSTPQARIIRSDSDEWIKIIHATEKARVTATACGNVDCEKTCNEMIEALQLSRCLLLMGYVNGCPLLENDTAFSTQAACDRTGAALGRVLLLDLVLRNEDRLACQQLGWRGNAGNLLATERPPIFSPLQERTIEIKLSGRSTLPRNFPKHTQQRRTQSDAFAAVEKHLKLTEVQSQEEITPDANNHVHIVAIDSGVPRRPPGHKRELDKVQFPKFVELVLNDLDTASEVLYEISGGHLGCQDHRNISDARKPCSGESIDQIRVTNAFRSGFRAALKEMHTLRTFLLKLYRRLDHYLKQFVVDIGENLPSDWSPEKSSPVSATSSPSSVSPQSRLERRFTLQLKDFNKLAKVDGGIQERLEHWDEVLRSEGYKLCQTHGFVTGFLEDGGSHSLVDSYELKIRLEHILERVDLIVQGGDTQRPSRVLEFLYIGGALAAKSFHTLERLGITHILCLCPIEVGPPEADVLQAFEYKSCQVLDIEEEDIASHFEEACRFIENSEKNGGKILVHCFEGKSRSATIVLAYLIIIKGQTLLNAWTLLKAMHPRSQPNDAFMRALGELETQLHAKSSMDWQKRKPVARICPVCGKNVGLSNDSLKQHMHKFHTMHATQSPSMLLLK